MTRRWFLKLVSILIALFDGRSEARQALTDVRDVMERERWDKEIRPQWTELEARCRVPGTLTAAVLNAGMVFRFDENTPRANARIELEDKADFEESSGRKSMDGTPMFQLVALPLPRLDTVERVEAATLGLGEPLEVESHKLYGVFNHPARLTCRVDRMDSVLVNVLKMRQHLVSNKFYGPYIFLYPKNLASTALEQVARVEGITDCLAVEGLAKIALVQLTPDVIQMVVCPDRIVPRVRNDHYGNAGICIGEE